MAWAGTAVAISKLLAKKAKILFIAGLSIDRLLGGRLMCCR
jgi:hypothetical protein